MKNTVCLVLVVLVILFAITVPMYAVGGDGHHRGGGHHGGGWHGAIWIGPGWGPWWRGSPYYPYYYPHYPYYPYYPERPAVIERQPQTYVQPEEQYYWYYCKNPEGYYPYVKKCPGGWLKVIPSAPPDEEE